MKKQLIAIAVISMLACFTGCGTDSSSSSSAKEGASASSAASTEEATTASSTEAKTTTAEKTTEAVTEADEEYSVSVLAGEWTYQECDQSASSGFVGIDKGSLTVDSEGVFHYVSNDNEMFSGTVKVDYEEYSDGSKVPFYSFTKDNGEFWIGCPCETDDTDTFYIGNGGMSRIIRGNGGSSSETDSETPNEYGFYEYKEPPRDGTAPIKASDIEGRWMHGQFLLEVTDCDMYSGKFTDEGEDGNYAGTVKLEYTKDGDSKQLWYNLYTDDGKLFKSFKATGDIPLNSITDSTQYGIEHERILN